MAHTPEDRPLTLAGREYTSRLIIGTGKYESYQQNARALDASARRSSPLRFGA